MGNEAKKFVTFRDLPRSPRDPRSIPSTAGPSPDDRSSADDSSQVAPQADPQLQLATHSKRSLPVATAASSLATLSPETVDEPATHSNFRDNRQATHSKARQAARPNQKQAYQARNLVTVAVRFDVDLNKRINDLCYRLNIEKQEFFHSIASYILELPEHELATVLGESVASRLAHDDMRIFNTCDDIIMRYETYTGQKWTKSDDRVGSKYNGLDPKLIEIALIMTIERKLRGNTSKIPIKSFNYFSGEIDNLVEEQKAGRLPGTLGEYHQYVLNTWNRRIKQLRDEKWETRQA